MSFLKVIFVLSSWNIKELFKNSVRKKRDKKLQQEICNSPHPFSEGCTKMHPSLIPSHFVTWILLRNDLGRGIKHGMTLILFYPTLARFVPILIVKHQKSRVIFQNTLKTVKKGRVIKLGLRGHSKKYVLN